MSDLHLDAWVKAKEAAKRIEVCITCEMGATSPGRHEGCTDAPAYVPPTGLLQMIPSTWEKE